LKALSEIKKVRTLGIKRPDKISKNLTANIDFFCQVLKEANMKNFQLGDFAAIDETIIQYSERTLFFVNNPGKNP